MMNNKSIELAKLLDIEPQYPTIFQLTFDKTLLEKGIVGEAIEDGKFIYPDFTKSDNFVKLINLIIKKCRYNIMFFAKNPKNAQEELIDHILTYNYQDDELAELKNHAQQIEWSY